MKFIYLEHMIDVEHELSSVDRLAEDVLPRLRGHGLEATWTPTEALGDHARSGTVDILTGQVRRRLPAVASLTANSADLALLPHDGSTVLITRTVDNAIAASLAARGWGGFLDLAGRASLRAPGLVVELSGTAAPRATTSPPSPRAPFTRAGLPVTLALLDAHGQHRIPTQRELADAAGVSIGTVNRVLRGLRDRTPALLGSDGRLLHPELLEDEWVMAYAALQPRAWPEEHFTSTSWGTPRDVLDAQLPPGVALGSELAAAAGGASIRPTTALIHVPGAQRGEVLRAGRLRSDANGSIRLRPAPWVARNGPEDAPLPRALLRADLLLEDDPRTDAIARELRGERA